MSFVKLMTQVDNGAWALAFLLEVLGIPANPEIIRHRSGAKIKMDVTDIVRATKHFSVKSDAKTDVKADAKADAKDAKKTEKKEVKKETTTPATSEAK
jgi:hypothetical protein